MVDIESFSYDTVKYWRLGSSLIGRPFLYVNCYWIDGVLIDTGQSRAGASFVQALTDVPLDKIILTHHHEDHSGNINLFKKVRGVDVYGSAICRSKLLSPERLPPSRWWVWGQNEKADIKVLDSSQVIDTEYHQLEIIKTPGHAHGHYSYFERERGWLFAGDIYLNDWLKIFTYDEQFDEHIASLKKLIKLDFEVLFCAHQPVLKNGKAALQRKLEFLQDYLEKVRKVYDPDRSVRSMMKELGLKEDHLYKHLSYGSLSRENMLRSAIKVIQNETVHSSALGCMNMDVQGVL